MCGCYELKAKATTLNKRFPLLHLSQADMPRPFERYPSDRVLMIASGLAVIRAVWPVGDWSAVFSTMSRAIRSLPCPEKACPAGLSTAKS